MACAGKASTPSRRRYWRNCSGSPSAGNTWLQGCPARVPDSRSSRRPLNSGAFFAGWITRACQRSWVSASTSACRARMATPSVLAAGSSFSKNPRSSRRPRFSASSWRTCAATPSRAARSAVSRLSAAWATVRCSRFSSRNWTTSARSRASSSRAPASSPAMLLPNSNAHSAMAAQNPNTTASMIQRSGQGSALRTATRGAEIVRRRRSRRKRIGRDKKAAQKAENRPKGGFPAACEA